MAGLSDLIISCSLPSIRGLLRDWTIWPITVDFLSSFLHLDPIWKNHTSSGFCLLFSEAFTSKGIRILGPSTRRHSGANICLLSFCCVRVLCVHFTHLILAQFSCAVLSSAWLFVTPWTTACQAPLSITNSQSLLKLMLSPSPSAFNLSQHQRIFYWVISSHQVAKVLEFQL